jgi:hypothetical protein
MFSKCDLPFTKDLIHFLGLHYSLEYSPKNMRTSIATPIPISIHSLWFLRFPNRRKDGAGFGRVDSIARALGRAK